MTIISTFPTVKIKAWTPQILVALYFTAVLAGLIAAPILAINWLSKPSLGVLFWPDLSINGQPATIGACAGCRLVAVDGRPVNSSVDVMTALSDRRSGETVEVLLRGFQQITRPFQVAVTALPISQRIAYFVLPYLAGLISLASAIWVYSQRKRLAGAQAFAMLAAALAFILSGSFDLFTTQRLAGFWIFSLAITAGALIDLALTFPQQHQPGWRLRLAGYLPAVVILLWEITSGFEISGLPATGWILRAATVYTGTAALFFLVWSSLRQHNQVSPIESDQLRILQGGMLAAFLPQSLGLALNASGMGFSPWWLLALVIFPILSSYAIARYRLLSADAIFSRLTLYGLMTALAAAVYTLIVAGFSLIFSQAANPDSPWLVGILVFLLVLVFRPVRTRLQRAIDALFFRGEEAYQEKQQAFGRELTEIVGLTPILRILHRYIEEAVAPFPLHIYLFDPLGDQYIAAPDESGQPTSDLRFGSASPLSRHLATLRSPLFLIPGESLPAGLAKDRTRIQLLSAQVFIPLPGRERLSGWLALGASRTGEPYSNHDLAFLSSLADQAALAIGRAQLVADLERQVREMDVLARVAQGINVTLAFDDILELIYAQTNQVVPTRDFWLTLYEPSRGTFQYAFYLENDERLKDMENKPLDPGKGLAGVVVSTRRAILTTDYQQECQHYHVAPAVNGIYAWVGVPLNAGAETIGALSLASRDPQIVFTTNQLNLIQAIADQAAGAIVKAHLLQESLRRAHHLAIINEVTRQLTSTLDLEPLLQNILGSAVEILNCEAGSLLMVDNATGELVFRVTAGPVAADLVNRRMPPGSGLVGKSVETRQPLIVNDVQQETSWFSKTDKQTGFVTRAVLVVPLLVKDTVIGVIEVINKRDGLPFTGDDQELLSGFAAQAGVAIENARLYTLTDQALAARVEELSAMQRIDRELNTSLDVSRAMRITLEWAMRQSGASAGLAGVIEDGGLRIMAAQGYHDELSAYQEQLLPLNRVNADGVALNEQVVRIDLGDGSANARLLPDARRQLILTIRRDELTIGLLVMESKREEAFPDEVLGFLTRLSDHAAIAIANARLYSDVQAANQAKSEFVSFVSHELKNPMTSIKGYTELLAAGAVGPVSEAQANFLATIRTNTERMSTLVSDLADVSRIESGRLRLDFKAVDVAEVCDEVVRSNRRQIDEKEQRLAVRLDADLPTVWADRTRLGQVLTNLVTNACKYTPKGGEILLSAEKCANRWDPNGAPQVAHVWVKDNGIGISEEDQTRIFQKFFRSEDPKTREAPGTGLGLNITRSLVEMQGGKIWFESEFRQGTTFHFTIPLAE